VLFRSIISIGLLILFVDSCYLDETLLTSEIVTKEVSFSADIQPIFNSSCNSSGCHNAGGESPELTSVNAYNQLISNNLVKAGNPEESELYQWMNGSKTLPMPVNGINAEFNALVFAWIEQGALDN